MQHLIIRTVNRISALRMRFSGYFSTTIFYCKAWSQGIPVGKNLQCWGKVFMKSSSPKSICLGDSVTIVSNSGRCIASSVYSPCKLQTMGSEGRIFLEDDVGINRTSIVARSKVIRIGKGTMIAPNCTIVDSDFHSLLPVESRIYSPGFERDADVTIGENVWMGMQVIVLKGATIGEGSVIGAGSVVVGNIPSFCVAAGVPARVIK